MLFGVVFRVRGNLAAREQRPSVARAHVCHRPQSPVGPWRGRRDPCRRVLARDLSRGGSLLVAGRERPCIKKSKINLTKVKARLTLSER